MKAVGSGSTGVVRAKSYGRLEMRQPRWLGRPELCIGV
jgi:hypothetical protein